MILFNYLVLVGLFLNLCTTVKIFFIDIHNLTAPLKSFGDFKTLYFSRITEKDKLVDLVVRPFRDPSGTLVGVEFTQEFFDRQFVIPELEKCVYLLTFSNESYCVTNIIDVSLTCNNKLKLVVNQKEGIIKYTKLMLAKLIRDYSILKEIKKPTYSKGFLYDPLYFELKRKNFFFYFDNHRGLKFCLDLIRDIFVNAEENHQEIMSGVDRFVSEVLSHLEKIQSVKKKDVDFRDLSNIVNDLCVIFTSIQFDKKLFGIYFIGGCIDCEIYCDCYEMITVDQKILKNKDMKICAFDQSTKEINHTNNVFIGEGRILISNEWVDSNSISSVMIIAGGKTHNLLPCMQSKSRRFSFFIK